MQYHAFYNCPIKGRQEIDYVAVLAETIFQTIFRTGVIGFSRDMLSTLQLSQLETELTRFLEAIRITETETKDFLLVPAISRYWKVPILFPARSKHILQKQIITQTEKLLMLLEELKRYSENESDSELIPFPVPPPPPPPPPMISSFPKASKNQNQLESVSPRLPKALKKDPKDQLHDELKNGKVRLRAISIQRTPSGTPKPIDKVPQIVTFQDIAMEALRKKFRLQQEE
jgi:hypothetical protein